MTKQELFDAMERGKQVTYEEREGRTFTVISITKERVYLETTDTGMDMFLLNSHIKDIKPWVESAWDEIKDSLIDANCKVHCIDGLYYDDIPDLLKKYESDLKQIPRRD